VTGYNYFAIEGPISVGKTHLARAIAKRLNSEYIESTADENPFLEKFYRDPKHYAFPTQIFFLLTRYRLLSSLYELDLFHKSVITDFIFERDELYARLLLNDAEFRLYRQVEQNLRKDLPKPQLVIFLQTPIEMLVRKIAKEGRPFEKKFLTEEFLSKLSAEYTEFFFKWTKTPLLVIDVSTVNLDNHEQLDQLVDYIVSTPINGQQFYSSSRWI